MSIRSLRFCLCKTLLLLLVIQSNISAKPTYLYDNNHNVSFLPFEQLSVNIFRTSGFVFADGVVALFGSQYSASVDAQDIDKFPNFNEGFSIRRGTRSLGLESRPLVAGVDSLYFNMSNFGQRSYTMQIDGSNFVNTSAVLIDNFTNTQQVLNLIGSTSYVFTVTSDVASASNTRFVIVLTSVPAAKITWTGNADNSFTNANNWDLNRIPIASDSVVIPSVTNLPLVDATTKVYNVTVNPNAYFSLASGKTISIMSNVLLQSTVNGAAAIANNAGTIDGYVTIERFVPSNTRKKYVLLTSPVTTTINAAWQEANAIISGYGTHITASVAQGTNGFDGPITSRNSIFTYNDNAATGSKWTALGNTNTAASLAPGKGYLLFVRGDRSENRPALLSSSNTTLRATGVVGAGTISPALLPDANKYSLIANPYPCAIDWNSSAITKTNLTNNFTVYDANLDVFISSDGVNRTPDVGNQQVGFIQSGQAFFVQNTADGNGAITLTENAKTTSIATNAGATVFGEPSSKERLTINVFKADNKEFADGVVALFGKAFSADIDKTDIDKFANFNETIGLKRADKMLGLETRPSIKGLDTLYLNLKNFAKKKYTMVINANQLPATDVIIEDKYTLAKFAINASSDNSYQFAITDDIASMADDRFKVILNKTNSGTFANAATVSITSLVLSPNPTANSLQVNISNSNAKIQLQIINALGQTLYTTTTSGGKVTIPVNNLAKGIYTVQLLNDGKLITSKLFVKE